MLGISAAARGCLSLVVNTFEKTLGLHSSSGTGCKALAFDFSESFGRDTDIGVVSLTDKARRLTSGIANGVLLDVSESTKGLNWINVGGEYENGQIKELTFGAGVVFSFRIAFSSTKGLNASTNNV